MINESKTKLELELAKKKALENLKESADKIDFNKLAELYREEQESTQKAKQGPEEEPDDTVTDRKLPNTGTKVLIIIMSFVLIYGVIKYIRIRNLRGI